MSRTVRSIAVDDEDEIIEWVSQENSDAECCGGQPKDADNQLPREPSARPSLPAHVRSIRFRLRLIQAAILRVPLMYRSRAVLK